MWGRRMYAADGRFEMGNMQDWQHAAMYSAFMVSGLVDLVGFYLPGLLPTGTEHVRQFGILLEVRSDVCDTVGLHA